MYEYKIERVLTVPHHGSEMARAEVRASVFNTRFPFCKKADLAATVTFASAKYALRIWMLALAVAVAAAVDDDDDDDLEVDEAELVEDALVDEAEALLFEMVNELVVALVLVP